MPFLHRKPKLYKYAVCTLMARSFTDPISLYQKVIILINTVISV